MAEAFFRQAILHGVIAAVLVEALLTTWRIRSASARLKFWLIALGVPFLLLPCYFFLAPFRLDDHFAAGWALFASVRWNAVRLANVAVDRLAFGVLALAGVVLLLRDLVPLVIHALRERGSGGSNREPRQPANGNAIRGEVEGLRELVHRHASLLNVRPPTIEVLPQDAPVLFVRGIRSHVLVASTGALARLSPDERAAAVAHELAHVRFRDPLVGWLLMAARLVMFWNPAVQLVARAIAQESEHRADAAAVRATSAQAYLAAFRLLALHDQLDPGHSDPGAENPQTPTSRDHGARSRARAAVARLHRHHVETRSTALAVLPDEPASVFERVLALSAVLAGLLFFVV